VVEFEVGGITSGDTTEGHRRHGKGPFTIKSFDDYKKMLEGKGKVILSADARKALIIEQARQACSAKGLELVEGRRPRRMARRYSRRYGPVILGTSGGGHSSLYADAPKIFRCARPEDGARFFLRALPMHSFSRAKMRRKSS